MLYQSSLVEFMLKTTCTLGGIFTCSLVDKPIYLLSYILLPINIVCLSKKNLKIQILLKIPRRANYNKMGVF